MYISLPPFPYCCGRFFSFWGAQESSWGHGFSLLCSYIPSPSASPPLTGVILPSSLLSKLHVPDILLNFAWVVMLYGFQGSCWYVDFLHHLSGTFLLFYLNNRLCSQVTLDCISHKTQAFVVLLFQSLSQTASLVHRHTPSPKNCE